MSVNMDTVKYWVTEGLQNFFDAEISNERHGGITPSTLDSAVDSLFQCPDAFDLEQQDLVSLAVLLTRVDKETELRDLL